MNQQNSNLALILIAISMFGATACGKGHLQTGTKNTPVSTVTEALPSTELSDGSVVRGRAFYTLENEQQTAMMKLFNRLIPSAYAASDVSQVTYKNSESTEFKLDVSDLGGRGFDGDTLQLGSFKIAAISDNNLRVCGEKANQRCTRAVIRVYTKGNYAGFVNEEGGYGAPVYVGQLNPSQAVGLDGESSVEVDAIDLGKEKNKLTVKDFANPSYDVTSDFSNAGVGAYSMTLIIEYALLP